MRADRLLSILFVLQHGAAVTVRELAERLEVSARTIARDLESLGAAGVPVYAVRGRRGGWRLAEGFRTRLNGLKEEDLRRLLLSQSTSVRLFSELGREKEFRETWDKLFAAAEAGGGNAGRAVEERIHIDGAGWRTSFEAFPMLPLLYDAVWSERTVRIGYGRSADEREWSERDMQPLGLVAKGAVWYAVGLVNGECRTYRVSRIRSVKETGETFVRPASFDLASYWTGSLASFRQQLPVYRAVVEVTSAGFGELGRLPFATLEPPSAAAAERAFRNGAARAAVEADFGTEQHAAACILRLAGEAKRSRYSPNHSGRRWRRLRRQSCGPTPSLLFKEESGHEHFDWRGGLAARSVNGIYREHNVSGGRSSGGV